MWFNVQTSSSFGKLNLCTLICIQWCGCRIYRVSVEKMETYWKIRVFFWWPKAFPYEMLLLWLLFLEDNELKINMLWSSLTFKQIKSCKWVWKAKAFVFFLWWVSHKVGLEAWSSANYISFGCQCLQIENFAFELSTFFMLSLLSYQETIEPLK